MNFEFQHLIPADFHPSSRVWIYQSSRLFAENEALQIGDVLADFLAKWNTHGTPVKGYARLLFGQFIVFMADETAAGVSGCSTDSSVRVIKQVEEMFSVDMFNRQLLAFIIKEDIQTLPLARLNDAWENGFINADTLYFNNLAATKEALLSEWLVPVKESWLAKKITAYSI